MTMSNRRIPVLVYHHVYHDDAPELACASGETGAGIIGATDFRMQLQYLADEGWATGSTTQLVDSLDHQTTLPPRAVVLHFDNGWLDTTTVTLPILRQFSMTATCYPITDGVESAAQGRSTAVRTLTEGTISKPFMNWEQLAALLDAGWEIGAHTATHCKVAEKHAAEGDDAVLAEAEASNELFKKHLGLTPEHFAYPSGSRNEQTDLLLARCYRSLRRWHFEQPICWTFTDQHTSRLAIECQNVDMRVSFDDFKRIFEEANSHG